MRARRTKHGCPEFGGYPMNKDIDELKIGYLPIQPGYSQYIRKVPLRCM
jgi:hypothetical protein